MLHQPACRQVGMNAPSSSGPQNKSSQVSWFKARWRRTLTPIFCRSRAQRTSSLRHGSHCSFEGEPPQRCFSFSRRSPSQPVDMSPVLQTPEVVQSHAYSPPLQSQQDQRLLGVNCSKESNPATAVVRPESNSRLDHKRSLGMGKSADLANRICQRSSPRVLSPRSSSSFASTAIPGTSGDSATELTGAFDECGMHSGASCVSSLTHVQASKRNVAQPWASPRSSLPAGSANQVSRLGKSADLANRMWQCLSPRVLSPRSSFSFASTAIPGTSGDSATEVTGAFSDCGMHSGASCVSSSTANVQASQCDAAQPWASPRSSLPAGSAYQACRLVRQRSATLPTQCYLAPDANQLMKGMRRTEIIRQHRNISVEGAHRKLHCNESANDTCRKGRRKDYMLGKEIGRGSYAVVRVGIHTGSGKKVAIKTYVKRRVDAMHRRKSVHNEIRLMENMSHPNVVILHEVVDTSEKIYLIMEYIDGGSIVEFLKRTAAGHLDEKSGKCVIWHMYQGIEYLHRHCIVHRDIKLENLLLVASSCVVKIIDFGFSTIVAPGEKLKNFCGTPSYMAPEIVTHKEYSGFSADVWATGVVVFVILCGRFPFRGRNDQELHRKIARAAYHIHEAISAKAKDLLRHLFARGASSRPTVRGILADEWFTCTAATQSKLDLVPAAIVQDHEFSEVSMIL